MEFTIQNKLENKLNGFPIDAEWFELLIIERDEISNKINNLKKMIESPPASWISTHQHILVEQQLRIMTEYFQILTKRIETFSLLKNFSPGHHPSICMLDAYECKKIVKAVKITFLNDYQVAYDKPNSFCRSFVDVGVEFMDKHKPEIGGYLVAYEDGYLSYSPAEAFEKGYTPI